MNKIACALAIMAAASTATADDLFSGRVVSVHDGDTVRVLDASNVQHKIRLQGIDAPEIGQPFGNNARDRLAALTMGKTVEVHTHGQDKYGRTLARLVVEGTDVDAAMIRDGLAWHYAKYDHSPALAAAEREARAARRGLWADKAPVPPWEWRASERERKPAAVTR